MNSSDYRTYVSLYERYFSKSQGYDAPLSKQELNNVLNEIARFLVPKKKAVKGDGYAYTSLNSELTKWRTSDGGELNVTLLGLIVDYAFDPINSLTYVLDLLNSGDVQSFLEEYVVDTPAGQEEYEEALLFGNDERNDEGSSTNELRFASTKQALQYLANVTGRRVKMVKEVKKTLRGPVKEAAQFVDPHAVLALPRKTVSNRELTRLLRQGLAAEEEATHLYEFIADATDNELVKKVVQDIANEERVHKGEFQKLLNELLKDEEELLNEGMQEVEQLKKE